MVQSYFDFIFKTLQDLENDKKIMWFGDREWAFFSGTMGFFVNP